MEINAQQIAQDLINEINKEVTDSQEQITIGKGAIHGVQELFNRLQKAQQELVSEQNSQPLPAKKTRKAKK